MSWLWIFIIDVVVLALTAWILPGVKIKSLWSAIFAVLIIGLLNIFVKPLITVLTLPVNILTLGLFSWIITAFIIWLASTIIKGFTVKNFGWAILAALVIAIINSLLTWFLPV